MSDRLSGNQVKSRGYNFQDIGMKFGGNICSTSKMFDIEIGSIGSYSPRYSPIQR